MDYKTVYSFAADELVEKKSRFIGSIAPASTEEEAMAFVEKARSKYKDASHNVYAYLLRTGQKRYSDDGEPQGTAGIPVLEVVEKAGLTDVVVVVTRYFGGTLLGAGGLVRAYTAGARIAMEAAGIKVMSPCTALELEADYSMYGKITYALPKYHIVTESADFGAVVRMKLKIKDKYLEDFKRELAELTAATVYPYETEKLYDCIVEKL